MLAWQARDQHLERGTSRAIAGVPADLEFSKSLNSDAVETSEHTLDVFLKDIARLDLPNSVEPVSSHCNLPKLLDVRTEERTPLKYHLEAVVIGGIVAACYLNAAIHVFS